MCVKVAVESKREHARSEVLGHACKVCYSQSAVVGGLPGLQINSARDMKKNVLLWQFCSAEPE